MSKENLLDLNDTPTFYLHSFENPGKILCPATIHVNMELDPITIPAGDREDDWIPAIGTVVLTPMMEILQRDGQFWYHFGTRDYYRNVRLADSDEVSHDKVIGYTNPKFETEELTKFDDVVFEFWKLDRELGHKVGAFLKFYGMAEGLNLFSSGSSMIKTIEPRYPVMASDLFEKIVNTAKLVVAPLEDGVWADIEYIVPQGSGTMSGRSAVICYELYMRCFTLLNILSKLSMALVQRESKIDLYRAQALYYVIGQLVQDAANEIAGLPGLIGKVPAKRHDIGTESHAT